MAALFPSLTTLAHAGTYVWKITDPDPAKSTQSPTYSGGAHQLTLSNGTTLTEPYYLLDSPPPDYGNGNEKGNYGDCSGMITTTYTWHADPGLTDATDPPPVSVIVSETCYVNVQGTSATTAPVAGICDTGLGVSAPLTQLHMPNGQSYVNTACTTPRYTVATGGKTVTLTCSPRAQCLVPYASTYVRYKPAISPITVRLNGTTLDASGNPHILIGQKCSATLSSMPSGCTATNIQWSVSGWTVQANSWVVNSGSASATFTGPNAAYTFTQATPSSTPPSWYWDDYAGPMTVTCTATVTPPTGQGAAFSVTAKRVVALDVPTYLNSEPVGVVYVNNVYLGNPGYNLHAGANPDKVPGIYFRDKVTTPPLYTSAGTGFWYRTQLASVSRYDVAKGGTPTRGAPGNTMPGAQDPYHLSNGGITYVYNNQTINADGSLFNAPFTAPENDSPGIQLSDTYQEYQVTKEKYEDYIMYHPPGDSIDVPLFYFQWSWNADVFIPPAPIPTSWSHWNNAPTGGTIAAPADGATQRMLIYPTWTSIVKPDLPT